MNIISSEGDDGKCSDADECLTENHDCSMYANCDNDVGYYQCTCNEGFSGDGFGVLGCSDLDECQSNPCLATEYCVNTMGSPRVLNIMSHRL